MQSKPSGGKPLISAAHTSLKPLAGGRTSPSKTAKVTKAKRKGKESLAVTTSKPMVGTAGSFRPANPVVSSLQPMSVLPESISPIHSNNPTPEPPPVVAQANPDQLVAPPMSKMVRSASSSSSNKSLSASSSGTSDSDSENLMQMLTGQMTSTSSTMPQVHAMPYHEGGHMTQGAGVVPHGASQAIAVSNQMAVHVPPTRLSEDSSSSSESASSDSDESSSSSGTSSSERALVSELLAHLCPDLIIHAWGYCTFLLCAIRELVQSADAGILH